MSKDHPHQLLQFDQSTEMPHTVLGHPALYSSESNYWASFAPERTGPGRVIIGTDALDAVVSVISKLDSLPRHEYDDGLIQPWDPMTRLHKIEKQVRAYGLDASEAIEACVSRLRRAVDLCDRVHKMLAIYPDYDEQKVQSLLGRGSSLEDLRSRGGLLAIPMNGTLVYPEFQFDRDERRIIPEARRVNELLGAADDPWGVAAWWVQPHGGLNGCPVELLIRDEDERAKLVQAAAAVVEHHG